LFFMKKIDDKVSVQMTFWFNLWE